MDTAVCLRKMSCNKQADNECLATSYWNEYDGEETMLLASVVEYLTETAIGRKGSSWLLGQRNQCITVEKACWWPLDSLWWPELAEAVPSHCADEKAEGQTGSRVGL